MANPLYDTLFGKHAGKTTPFLTLQDGTVWTHAAFLETAARIAHVLTAAGLEPGDRLAAQIGKSPEALALYAACAQAGVVFLPLNTAYTVDELTYFIENSGAAMVVCAASRTEALTTVATELGAQVETLIEDGTGSRLFLLRFRGLETRLFVSADFDRQGGSPLYQVPCTARFVVLFRGDEVVDRYPIELTAGETEHVRLAGSR